MGIVLTPRAFGVRTGAAPFPGMRVQGSSSGKAGSGVSDGIRGISRVSSASKESRACSGAEAGLASRLTSLALAGLLTVAPVTTLAGALSLTTLTTLTTNVGRADAVTNEQLLYLEAWRAVDRAYVDKTFNGQSWFRVREDTLKKKKLLSREDTYSEIKSMLASLGDPFTRFLEPDQYKALRGATSGGKLVGCGLEVSFRSGSGSKSLYVVSPAAKGPAERAGIRPGDEILKINGRDTGEMSLYAAGNALQGSEGSTATLTVRRGDRGTSKEFEVEVTREKIDSKSVEFSTCGDDLGYLRIGSFSRMTAEDVLDALESFKGKGVGHIVLDVRNNGGGVFNAGVQVARMLINSGDLVLIADSDGVRDVVEAEGQAIDTKTPMVVLVNKGTASASEVLAGALKDNKRATIAGENSFGKGLIQTLVELSDGSAITVTVSKYQTPNGIDINKKGIAPDVILSDDEMERIPVGSKKFCSWSAGADEADGKILGKILA